MTEGDRTGAGRRSLRSRLHETIFGTETPAGRAFDVALLVAIVASVLVVMLDSVPDLRARYGSTLRAIEWGFTVLFTVEYLLRLWVSPRPGRYARSFFGVVDLLAVLPTYVSVLVPGGEFLVVVRILRVIRVFRILKLVHFVGEGAALAAALRASRHKISVFLVAVLCVVVIVGSLMYLIEGADAGFTSIPAGVYWAIVTLTTVGYGDIAPQTTVGQFFAGMVMIMGYGVIAVPTGIVTVELGEAGRRLERERRAAERREARAAGEGGGRGAGGAPGERGEGGRGSGPGRSATAGRCGTCGAGAHATDALYCRKCGSPLP